MRKSPQDTRPEKRSLRIYAFDPMLARAGDFRVTVAVPYRELKRDEHYFHDDRLEVVDYDGAAQTYYRALDLDDPKVAMQQGVEPSEADPQFHQQMVYAVASRVIENFDLALGRRLSFRGGRLRLLPHAFRGRNAFYDPGLVAVLFGYFSASDEDPGANLPGQPVFSCLSHDIIAHEVTHAAVDRLHPFYREPSNPHVPALHEGFADLVAIFQRFTYPDVLRQVVTETRGDLRSANPLRDLAAQFGQASGSGAALRSAIDTPDPARFARTHEPHDLGAILVAAVFDGFFRTYQRRSRDLLRIATGGTGRLPDGELHPDLVNRLSSECVRTAQTVLSMCIRATDYLPPVDPTFSDFLRAMITADFELNRADEVGLRAAMIEAFRVRGIRPESVDSLGVESMLLEPEDPTTDPDDELAQIVQDVLIVGARQISRSGRRGDAEEEKVPTRRPVMKVGSTDAWIAEQKAALEVSESEERSEEDDEPDATTRKLGSRLWSWAKGHRSELGLDLSLPMRLTSFHPVHRVAPSGELLVEMVAKFVQQRPAPPATYGGVTYRAGVTLVAGIDGRIRYLIRKPFHPAREERLRAWVAAFDAEGGPSWTDTPRSATRLLDAYSTRAMDGRRWR